MDSINGSGGSFARAPGADDDGSGSVNLMEAFRVLVTSGFKPTNPVEFHWYICFLILRRDRDRSY